MRVIFLLCVLGCLIQIKYQDCRANHTKNYCLSTSKELNENHG